MGLSLYRCRAKAWLKPAGWSYAVRFDETEIQSAKVDIGISNPGQAAGFKTGYALYENSSSCQVEIKDKYLLKAGWLGIESSQRLQFIPELDIPQRFRTSLEELTEGIQPPGTLGFIRDSIVSFIIVELSYQLADSPTEVRQRYFFRIHRTETEFGDGSFSKVTFHGKGLYRSLLSQTRENFSIKKGTPVKEVAKEMAKYVTTVSSADGRTKLTDAEVRTEADVQTPALAADLRTNGDVPGKALAAMEATNNVRVVEYPNNPLRINIISDAPHSRTVFYMGKGLFEGCSINGESDLTGSNAIRAAADRYNGTRGANTSTYVLETDTTVDVDSTEITPYLTGVNGSDTTQVVFTIPETSETFTYDLSKWMEKRSGLTNVKSIDSEGNIETFESAHAAFDTEEPSGKVVTLFGGEVTKREDNATRGNGTITVKSNGYLNIGDIEYQVYEEYSHAINHVELGKVSPGQQIAEISNKSALNSSAEVHLHGTYYIQYKGQKTFVNPFAVAKLAYIKQITSPSSSDEGGGVSSGGTEREADALLRIVLAEARTTGITGMALVARATLNRSCLIKTRGANFNTRSTDLYDIIVAPGQYEPTWSTTNNWKDAYTKSTEEQKQLGRQAITLAQDPDQLKQRIIDQGYTPEQAENLILSSFFAARRSIIEGDASNIIEYREGNKAKHYFGRARRINESRATALCNNKSIDGAAIAEGSFSTEPSASLNGTSGTANTSLAAIGNSGFQGFPEIELFFVGIPRALFIQPGFTYLVFDSRGFEDWAESGGKTNKDFQMPIPSVYKDWSIIGVSYQWEGDLRVGIKATRPLFGLTETFKFRGYDFKDDPQWGGNYKKYIRSFTDLCYKVVGGQFDGKSSCEIDANINTAFAERPDQNLVGGNPFDVISPTGVSNFTGNATPGQKLIGNIDPQDLANFPLVKPPYRRNILPSNTWRRTNGRTINGITLHNTNGGTAQPAIDTLIANGLSAHYLVDRDGSIQQLVEDKDVAFHGTGTFNPTYIGIEIVAKGYENAAQKATAKPRGMTIEQETSVVRLVNYLVYKYNIPRSRVQGHRTGTNTACPNGIWDTEQILRDWVNTYIRNGSNR